MIVLARTHKLVVYIATWVTITGVVTLLDKVMPG